VLRSFSTRLVVSFAVLSLLVGLSSSWVVFEQAQRQQLERIRTELSSVAATAAVAIDAEIFASLQRPSQQDAPGYRVIQEQLDRIRHANEDIRFVYTMRLDPQGVVRFVVDAPAVDFDGNGRIDDDEEMAVLGEAYPAAETMPALFEGFEHPSADRALTSDRWGQMLSGYAPILDNQGRAVGLVGVDMMASRLDQARAAFLLASLAVVLVVALASLLLSGLISWRLTRPLRAMRRELGELERDEREHLSVTQSDEELELLARAFNAQLDSRRRTERKLQEGAKLEALAQLSAAMAHDFANHLTVVAATTELMLMSVEEGSDQQRRLLRIQRAAQGASAEVRRLLVFARQAPQEHTLLDLNEVVTTTVDLARSTTKQGVRLHTEIEAHDAWLHGDPSALQSALLNLALNARDAMPDGGELTLGTRWVEDADGQPRLRVWVRDSGTGMSDKVQQRLFEPFFSTKPSGRGTGLGMMAVKSAAEQHGATIQVDTLLGAGTTVSVDFPPADRPPGPDDER
jgi:signal transduction histidine kinase